MQFQKTRWSKVYESSEEELQDFLAARHLTAERQTAAEFETVERPATDQASTIWCAEGSMTLRADGTKLSLQPGDSVRVPNMTPYHLLAGISGCVYYVA